MRYWWIALTIAVTAGCSGHSSPGPVSPISLGSPLTGNAPRMPLSTVADSVGIPDAPVIDSALLVADFDDERRQAADSAADEAVLEELAEAHPGGGAEDNDGDETAESAPGGANALADAVTWDIDVATYNSHDRVQY
jgi:hypothetical protein